jgi:predicted nucleic acid-binding protein
MNILDASVIIKWFVIEEDSDKAIFLRNEFIQGKSQIAVPDLVLYEITNALSYNKNISIDKINMALEAIFDIELNIVTPTLSELKTAIFISKEFEVSIYDSTYLALASILDFQFITADEKFYKKII